MISKRRIVADDEAQFNEWLAKDDLHKSLGLTFADVQEPGTEAYLVSDASGPLMVVRRHRATRIAIQFDPSVPIRTARASKEILEWIKSLAREDDAIEIIIRPGSKAGKFADHLGFMEFNGQFMKIEAT